MRVQAQRAFKSSQRILRAAVAAFGLACVPEDIAQEYVAAGRRHRVLEDWMPTFPGYHFYYASRLQHSPALALVVGALRHAPADKP